MSKLFCVNPFLKQCFVTSGVALNISGSAYIMSFTTALILQLKNSDVMKIDDTVGSWIAATPGISLVLGSLATPALMNNFGRKITNIISVAILLIGWLGITLAGSISVIIVSRFLQGIAMGMALNFGPILIGEYTSPKNRGALSMFASAFSAIGVLGTHAIGAYFSWQVSSLICMILSFVNLVIVIYSPESPVWLAKKNRYDECKKVFRWLRGDDEETELNDILKASIINEEKKPHSEPLTVKCMQNIVYFRENYTKREFYMPIFIMIHVYAIGQWAGINIISTYTIDVFENIIGKTENISLHIVALDAQRIISSVGAIYFIQNIKRKTILSYITGLGVLIMLITAGYTYAKSKSILPFDHEYIGVVLIHIHMFTVASCTISVPYIIAGEIYPLKFKGIAGSISIVFFAIHFGIVVKTAPYLLARLGIYGTYAIYAAVVAYSLLITMIFLPETKDRTLLDIENEFKDFKSELGATPSATTKLIAVSSS